MEDQTAQAASAGEVSSSSAALDSFAVDLGFFSGPLDLLLHLVRREELPIEDVDMAEICERYLGIVLEAVDLDLEVAAGFLVIAATLLAIKSESVLPASSLRFDGSELPEDSPYFEELRERLKRYERYKRLGQQLRETPQLGLETFSRKAQRAEIEEDAPLEIDETADSLASYFVQMMRRIGGTVNSVRISLESISIVDYMMQIVDRLKSSIGSGRNSFLETVRGTRRDHATARGAVIGGFLAVLELCKRGLIVTEQAPDGQDITISLRLGEGTETDEFEEEEVERGFGVAIEGGG